MTSCSGDFVDTTRILLIIFGCVKCGSESAGLVGRAAVPGRARGTRRLAGQRGGAAVRGIPAGGVLMEGQARRGRGGRAAGGVTAAEDQPGPDPGRGRSDRV